LRDRLLAWIAFVFAIGKEHLRRSNVAEGSPRQQRA
jgi:hypothetical protein